MLLLKKLALVSLTAIVLLSASLSGCSETASRGVGENVKLRWIMVGPGELPDSSLVWAAFNKELKSHMPNVEVEFEVFSMSDYKQQFMLMQTINEKVDIANAYSLNFADEVRKGTFYDIGELVSEYGKDMQQEIPEFVWDYMKVDGVLYGVPTYQMLCVSHGVYVPKVLADKYLDEEALVNAIRNNKTLTGDFLDVVENYLQKLHQAGEIGYGFNFWFDVLQRGFESVVDNYVIRTDDEECKIDIAYNIPENKAYYERKGQWYKKGYIRQDSLSASDDRTGLPGGYVMWQSTAGFGSAEQVSSQYNMDINCYSLDPDNEYYLNSRLIIHRFRKAYQKNMQKPANIF